MRIIAFRISRAYGIIPHKMDSLPYREDREQSCNMFVFIIQKSLVLMFLYLFFFVVVGTHHDAVVLACSPDDVLLLALRRQHRLDHQEDEEGDEVGQGSE